MSGRYQYDPEKNARQTLEIDDDGIYARKLAQYGIDLAAKKEQAREYLRALSGTGA